MSKALNEKTAILKGHLSIDDALSWPQEPEKAAEQHCDFLGQWQKLTDGLQDARTAMKKKWKT